MPGAVWWNGGIAKMGEDMVSGMNERVGDYRLFSVLGEGGMGVVSLGVAADGRAVAIKMLRPAVIGDPQYRRRLAREVDTLRRVRHPGVAQFLDADLDGENPFLVTAYVPADTLERRIEADGPLSTREVAVLGLKMIDALQAIHVAGIVHRDVKPANVLVMGDQPVLIDFGIAHVVDESRLTATGLVMGTPGYLPPELIEGQAISAGSDWWGWGATLAFAATGRHPFGSGNAAVVLDRVRRGQADLSGTDSKLAAIITMAMALDPATRPDGESLRVWLTPLAAVPAPPPAAPESSSSAQPKPTPSVPAPPKPAPSVPAPPPPPFDRAPVPPPLVPPPPPVAVSAPAQPSAPPSQPKPVLPPALPKEPAAQVQTEVVDSAAAARFHAAAARPAAQQVTAVQPAAHGGLAQPAGSPSRTVQALAGQTALARPAPAPAPFIPRAVSLPPPAMNPPMNVVVGPPDHRNHQAPGVIGAPTAPLAIAQPVDPARTLALTQTLLIITIGALSAVVPGLVAVGGFSWIWLCRVADRTQTATDYRRSVHGKRPSDTPVALSWLPLRLVATLPGALLGVLLPAILSGLAIWITSVLVPDDIAGGGQGIPTAVGGLVALVTAWCGPGNMALRRPTHRALLSLGRRPQALLGVRVLLVMLSIAAFIMILNQTPPDWAPLGWLRTGWSLPSWLSPSSWLNRIGSPLP